VAVGAAFIISQYPSFLAAGRSWFPLTGIRVSSVAAGVVLGILLIGMQRQLSEEELQSVAARVFPAAAVNFIQQNKLVGPLYNHLDWGGYLIWSLPSIPVAIDGRTNLHGDERIQRSVTTWAGLRGWDSDPELMQARLIIAGSLRPLASVLRIDPRFKLVYQDETALVFVPARQAQPRSPTN
jgi:hypothetical protein